MTRPKLENYRSRQPGLPDYERFFGYIKALEEYCNFLESQLEEMSKPQRGLDFPVYHFHLMPRDY